MLSAVKTYLLLIAILIMPLLLPAQDSLWIRQADSLYTSLKTFIPATPNTNEYALLNNESLLKAKIKSFIPESPVNNLALQVQEIAKSTGTLSKKPFLKLNGGYISYNWTDQAADDSSFIGNNYSQYLLSVSLLATIAQTLPIRVTYFDRQTNSPYFRDYRDIRIDVDVQKYRQLRMKRKISELQNLTGVNSGSLRQSFDKAIDQFKSYTNLLNDAQLKTGLIRAKEILARNDFADTSAAYIEKTKAKAAEFIRLYESVQHKRDQYSHFADSLHQLYQTALSKEKQVLQMLSGQSLSSNDIRQLSKLSPRGEEIANQINQAYDGIRSLSIGRTLPNLSPLTIQNINVKGINLEYTYRSVYLAVVAGLVDFRIRDFLYNKEKPATQYVYAGKIGYGTREGNNLMLTYFRGRKQLFGNSLSNRGSDIQGVSIGAQYYIHRNIRLYGEIAQSGVPVDFSNGHGNSSIRFTDESQRAWLVGVSGYFPKTYTSFEGHYQHSGLNYQSFNSFQYNAAATSWYLRAEQTFWKRQLTFQASLRKNDFNNPLILQRYNSNTIFKQFMLSFRRTNWPSVSVGLMPASQYTAVGNQVYENHYQTFTANTSYQYKIGEAKGSTLIAVSQFYNDASDTSFLYYDASNIYIGQRFEFKVFTATLNISTSKNSQYNLVTMEEGVSAVLFKKMTAGFTVKINHLAPVINKVGFTAKTGYVFPKMGSFNLWMDMNYLPSYQGGLYRYQMYNIGFTKYFQSFK